MAISNLVGPCALTAFLSVAVGAPASATAFYYQAFISGTLVSADGKTSDFAQVNTDTTVPAQYGRTGTTWQVGASATAQYGGTVFSQVDLAPQPQVIGVDYARNLKGQSVVTYRITLFGPAASSVPVEIKADGAISWTQNGDADAFFAFKDYENVNSFTPITKEINQSDMGFKRVAGQETFSIDTTVFLNTNDSYSITESTYAIGDVRQFATTTDYSYDNALVDPTFTVLGDNAALYTIQGVPVGDTVAPVPEPASWMMMVVGAGLATAGLHRRRRSPGTNCPMWEPAGADLHRPSCAP